MLQCSPSWTSFIRNWETSAYKLPSIPNPKHIRLIQFFYAFHCTGIEFQKNFCGGFEIAQKRECQAKGSIENNIACIFQIPDTSLLYVKPGITAQVVTGQVDIPMRTGIFLILCNDKILINVGKASALAFMSTENTDILTSFSQSAIRRIQTGDAVEIVFTKIPGQVFGGKIIQIGEATAEAQLRASATLETVSGTPARARWPVQVKLDDESVAAKLPHGAGGSLAVYTDAGAPFHIISKVVMRMNAWTGYLTAP